MDIFKDLKPDAIWRYFFELNQVPRESKHEAKAADYVISVAKKLNLSYKQDKTGNVVISKPGSPGHENAPGVILQGHLDMVCEKNKGTTHDFSKDPIKMIKDGDYITADGTTLGADNGIGVAAALAALESEDLVHPPLEALFTIDEETGLTGANALEEGFVKGKILINCDSEEDGALYVGCAGGKDTEIFFDIDWEDVPQDAKAVVVKIGDLKGGHSGLDIQIGRANAIKQLNRVIWNAAAKFDFRINVIDGGSKHNAIPREAEYGLMIKASEYDAFADHLKEYNEILKSEFSETEPNLELVLEDNPETTEKVFSKNFQSRVLNFIYAMPHGVVGMSHAIEGLVETSTNLAIVNQEDGKLAVLTSQRSSVASEIVDIADQVKALGQLSSADVHQGSGYPGWKPNMGSHILKVMKETHKELFGKEPEVKAIHAGLECGIIGEKSPGMDMVSCGPTILGAHSPDERVEISTVERFWQLLSETLRRVV